MNGVDEHAGVVCELRPGEPGLTRLDEATADSWTACVDGSKRQGAAGPHTRPALLRPSPVSHLVLLLVFPLDSQERVVPVSVVHVHKRIKILLIVLLVIFLVAVSHEVERLVESPGLGVSAQRPELLLLPHDEHFPESIKVLHSESPERPRGNEVSTARGGGAGRREGG